MGSPGGSVIKKNLPDNAGDAGNKRSITELGRCPEGENGNLLWKIPGHRSLEGYGPGDCRESDMT